ncbi:MAG TPA: DNA-binding transcriptional regulator [Luteolibacter sp.]|nr:DNA-binding transcriptional regulator [Luteolibacter sp.]
MKTHKSGTAPKHRGKNPKTVGFWMDVDLGLKLELETYAGCQRYAREAGWRLVLDPSIKRLHKWRAGRPNYDGILARATMPIAEAAGRAGMPFVNLWLNSPVPGIPSVLPDCKAAGVMAAEHLLGRGLRNFGYLGSRNSRDSGLQFKGFSKTVIKAGLQCSSYRYPHTLTEGDVPLWEEFGAGLEKWMDTWLTPVGIFVYQDAFCRFLIDACIAKGLSVPGDVAIVGCTDDTIICEAASPTLTSIDMGYEWRGYRAAAMLDRLMAGKKAPSVPELVLPARLIPRESSDIFAAPDPLVSQALRFIADNSHRMLRVSEVASVAGVSRRTLERKFETTVGRGIAEEMIRLRLNRAKRRLAAGNVPLKTVAQEAGFLSASHFSRVFTRSLGITPSRYRTEHQIKPE